MNNQQIAKEIERVYDAALENKTSNLDVNISKSKNKVSIELDGEWYPISVQSLGDELGNDDKALAILNWAHQ